MKVFDVESRVTCATFPLVKEHPLPSFSCERDIVRDREGDGAEEKVEERADYGCCDVAARLYKLCPRIHHTPFIVIYCRGKKKVLPIMPTTLSMHYNGFGYFICSVCYRDCYVPPPRFVDPIDRVVRKRSRPRRQRMSRGKSHAELCDLALGSFFVKGGVFSSD